MFLRAAFKFGNIVLLAAGVAVVLVVSAAGGPAWLPLVAGGATAAVYGAAVVSTMLSSKFKEQVKLLDRIDALQELSRECDILFRKNAARFDDMQKSRALGVIRQKDALMDFFKRDCDDPVRQRIIEQALKLVQAYLNLAGNYSDRMKALSPQYLNELQSRINLNNRKLGSLKNYEAVLELTKTVELDEKLLKNLKQEKEELEVVNVRLEQIVSTIDGFRHRILSSELSDPEAEEIEHVINEASALDNALNEHGRARQKA